jgi:hypothetical protein
MRRFADGASASGVGCTRTCPTFAVFGSPPSGSTPAAYHVAHNREMTVGVAEAISPHGVAILLHLRVDSVFVDERLGVVTANRRLFPPLADRSVALALAFLKILGSARATGARSSRLPRRRTSQSSPISRQHRGA